MAGIDGIKNRIDPGPSSDKDLYDLPPEELAQIPTVCGSLREALQELEKDHEFLLQGDVFTRDQLEGYMALKWEEVYAFEHTPHPIEYKMYYSLLIVGAGESPRFTSKRAGARRTGRPFFRSGLPRVGMMVPHHAARRATEIGGS
jgi:hypothetical protein